jgi:ATP-dependent Clp protease ATP-binding subunit ClpC
MKKRPLTSRTQRVLALADAAAASFGHEYVGTEHLLVGLVDEKAGVAAQILSMHGLSPDSVRAALAPLLSPKAPGHSPPNEEL